MCKFASCFPPCKPHPYRLCKTRRATESGRVYTEASHKHSLGRENGATRSTCRYPDEDLPCSWEILFLLCMRRYYEMGSYLIKHYNLKSVLPTTLRTLKWVLATTLRVYGLRPSARTKGSVYGLRPSGKTKGST